MLFAGHVALKHSYKLKFGAFFKIFPKNSPKLFHFVTVPLFFFVSNMFIDRQFNLILTSSTRMIFSLHGSDSHLVILLLSFLHLFTVFLRLKDHSLPASSQALCAVSSSESFLSFATPLFHALTVAASVQAFAHLRASIVAAQLCSHLLLSCS